ncbi:DUF3466 family protein [Vibrio scophthalmi]|uniref:DUF3466 family protein n=1 Tax=Vibrio scophthalmi TaxID=45658 RepID=UPI002FF1C14B
MSSKIFKISMIAATVSAACSANAALYQVFHYADGNSAKSFGVAIQPSDLNCWENDCIGDHDVKHQIAYEGKDYNEGFEYRHESPFLSRFGFDYIDSGDDIWSNFRNYCYNYLRYADTLCENWATNQYTYGYKKEKDGDIWNSVSFLEGTQLFASEGNVIVNAITDTEEAVGNYQTGDRRNTAFFGSSIFEDGASSRAWKSLSNDSINYVAGSVSSLASNAVDYTSKATIWENGTAKQIGWIGAVSNDRIQPQGAARDIALIEGSIYAVGYNSDSDEYLRAAVFSRDSISGEWSSQFISGFDSGDRSISNYLNSVVSAVNNNGKAVGTYKLRDIVVNGSYSNGLFYVSNVRSPSPKATLFNDSVLFYGANGKAGGINNDDLVVGAVDFETHREYNGKPRAQRAFITSLDPDNRTPIKSSYYLDDLTYSSSDPSFNNEYRLLDATDINDAGVISGTAYYCAGGFSTYSIASSCENGSEIVAVKLVPLSNDTYAERDIEKRPASEADKVDRQGGSLGFFALMLLSFLGFRRK